MTIDLLDNDTILPWYTWSWRLWLVNNRTRPRRIEKRTLRHRRIRDKPLVYDPELGSKFSKPFRGLRPGILVFLRRYVPRSASCHRTPELSSLVPRLAGVCRRKRGCCKSRKDRRRFRVVCRSRRFLRCRFYPTSPRSRSGWRRTGGCLLNGILRTTYSLLRFSSFVLLCTWKKVN